MSFIKAQFLWKLFIALPYCPHAPLLLGVPPLADYVQLEFTVVYNTCVYSLALSQFSEADLLLTRTVERGGETLWQDNETTICDSMGYKAMYSFLFACSWAVLLTAFSNPALQVAGADPVDSDSPGFWRAALKSRGDTALDSSIWHLLCLQWAVWLATCKLKTIQELQVRCKGILVHLFV